MRLSPIGISDSGLVGLDAVDRAFTTGIPHVRRLIVLVWDEQSFSCCKLCLLLVVDLNQCKSRYTTVFVNREQIF